MEKEMTEFQNVKRKKRQSKVNRTVPSLVWCLEKAGLPHMDRAVKDSHRNAIIAGLEKLPIEMQQNTGTFNDLDLLGDTDPYTPEVWENDIDSYCFDDDVMGTAALFFHWVENVLPTGKFIPIGQATFRAAYETAAAHIEFIGVPFDA